MGWSTISVQQWCKWRTTAPRTSGLCPRFSFYTKPWFFEEEVAETWLSMQARNKMICWQESKMKTNVCEIEVHVRQEKFISTHQVPPRTTWRNTSCIVSLPSGTRSTTSAPVRAALTAATLRKTVGEREKIVSEFSWNKSDAERMQVSILFHLPAHQKCTVILFRIWNV